MKYVVLGDTHFGAKKFCLNFFDNQMKFYTNQLIPFMVENNIKTIIQTGDLFDNRSVMDINFLSVFRERFMSLIVENDIKIVTFLGNHDIYFKNTLAVNSPSLLKELYPNNVDLITEQEIRTINNKKVGFVPFLVPNEGIYEIILKESDYIFGHFETQGFEMSKGVIDTHSELSQNTFQAFSNIKYVISGHYHIRNTKGIVKYVGIPYQSNWNDHNNITGFHVLDDNFNIEFYENTQSKRYIKIFVSNEVKIENEICSLNDLKEFLKNDVIIRCYIHDIPLDDTSFENVVFLFKENNIEYTLIDLREDNIDVSEITQEVTSNTNKETSVINKSTNEFIANFIENNHKDLLPLYSEIIQELEE